MDEGKKYRITLAWLNSLNIAVEPGAGLLFYELNTFKHRWIVMLENLNHKSPRAWGDVIPDKWLHAWGGSGKAAVQEGREPSRAWASSPFLMESAPFTQHQSEIERIGALG